jgi:hypothetical protein
MRTPPFVISYRAVTAALTAAILLSVGFGFAGYGPLTVLHKVAHPAYHALHLDRISG